VVAEVQPQRQQRETVVTVVRPVAAAEVAAQHWLLAPIGAEMAVRAHEGKFGFLSFLVCQTQVEG
jgi:hypothetical protein